MSMRQLKITKSITNRESQSLEKYLQEIGKVDLITPCLLYTSPSPRDAHESRMPSSA